MTTIAGVEPRAVVEPRDRTELAAIIGELYAGDRAFAFVGGGTELELGNAPRALDTVVRTTGCNRVIDYAPEDQTITVEAGMTIATLRSVLAEHGQFFAIDVADAERSTVGGVIATNRYGRRRTRYGSIKDSIVGIEIVRPDGTVAHGGGKVVKNVAGFDIPKLMVGALGSLGAISAATFRVHPIDRECGAVVFRALDIAGVMQVSEAIVAAALVPTSIVAYDAADAYDCVVTFEGFARGVEAQVRSAAAIAEHLKVACAVLGASEREPYELRERSVRATAPWRVVIGAAPQALGKFLASRAADGARTVFYPFLGAAFVATDDLDASTISRWRSELRGGTVILHAMPLQARKTLDAWGPPPAAIAIMRRLKANFDPKGLCNPGRFVGDHP